MNHGNGRLYGNVMRRNGKVVRILRVAGHSISTRGCGKATRPLFARSEALKG